MEIKECTKFYYDEKSADRVVAFIQRHIKHIKGEKGGQPFILEPFQERTESPL